MSISEIEATIKELEAQRCAALVANDLPALETMVAADLVHIHATGQVDDRDGYLRGVADRLTFLSVERSELKVRVSGQSAVATGRLDQRLRVRATGQEISMSVMTTQVWVLADGGWRQTTFQATSLPPAAAR